MKRVSLSLILAAASPCVVAAAAKPPPLPIHSGRYAFVMMDAEFPDQPGRPLVATIRGRHIVLFHEHADGVYPRGVIDEGTLMWHPATKEWIIGRSPSDRFAPEVGGCSDGPPVVDLRKRIYWSC